MADKKALPVEIIDQILQHVACSKNPDSPYKLTCSAPAVQRTIRSPNARRDIAGMRYVSRVFQACATPLLFEYIDARFPYHYHLQDRLGEWVARSVELSESPLAGYVRRLSVGFYQDSYGSDKADDSANCLSEASLVLPTLLFACRQLQALKISGPSQSTFGRDAESHETNHRLFIKILEHTFWRLSLSTRPATLVTLQMRLPLPYDYAELARTSAQTPSATGRVPLLRFMQDLRYLDIVVTDTSGLYTPRYAPLIEQTIGRTKHPSQASTRGLWEFVQSATTLRSLCITCMPSLDLDLLQTDSLTGLQELTLSRVKMSQDKFMKIVTQSASSLRAIELDIVELNTGNWQSTLLPLCEIPTLNHLLVESCGYSKDGASGHFATLTYAAYPPPMDIETVRFEDKRALGQLQRHVNAVRAAANLPCYNDRVYMAAELPPLEAPNL